jgi:predicted transcriptional regulator
MARLGELERAVMDVLWSAVGPRTARAIAEALPHRELAQTTVLTVLSRLEKKGVVRRDRAGRAHTYTAVATREDHVADLMREVLGTAPDKTAALARFVGTVSPEEAYALQEALRRAGRRGEPTA